eukprot:TRINITY_DN32780_c1_g1_i2.p1 TRINITY_DN32780_c1_g1~~TRINITY_DN32780_c1_g1_i2.p1  ORF type:complete len:508 (+),score=192.17 TRINITY_DN32780_c1_g1_i2:336-1859(+)
MGSSAKETSKLHSTCLAVLVVALGVAAALDTYDSFHLRGGQGAAEEGLHAGYSEGRQAERHAHFPSRKEAKNIHFNAHATQEQARQELHGSAETGSEALHAPHAVEASFRPPVVLLAVLQCAAVALFLRFCVPDDASDGASSRSASEGPKEGVVVDSFDSAGYAGTQASGVTPPSRELRSDGQVRHRHAPQDCSVADSITSSTTCDEEKSKSLFRVMYSRLSASRWSVLICVAIVVVTLLTLPDTMTTKKATVRHVFFYSWMTDLATGLGVIPFLCFHSVSKQYLGVANAVAAGMMSCASVQLFLEAISTDPCPDAGLFESPVSRCVAGILLGFVFIIVTKKLMDGHDEIQFGDLSGMDARKVLLIMVVMTLHSFTEGVGIGVAFGGERGASVGFCIAVCLTIHNIPEGLAVALVLVPRGVSKLNASLWCVLTSLPQPVMAVPAFLFVATFLPLLPLGLGFASGAMLWVAFFELLSEAASDIKKHETVIASTASFTCAYMLQHYFVD